MPRALVIAVVGSLAIARAAAAEPAPPPVLLDHVLTAPTAWLPEAGSVVGWTGLDHHGDGSIDLGYGLGGLAAVDVGADTDVRASTVAGGAPQPIALGRAGFRLGVPRRRLGAVTVGAVVGARATFAGDGRRVSDLYVVASAWLGPVRLHAGADAFDGKASSDGARLGDTIRPSFGAELTPPQYPRTTLLADVAWLPRFDGATPVVEYLAGGGVRYQALAWGAIELDVRAREGEGLGDARVMVRLDGVWAR
jgi:hypothetical protein|nr:hypothetical protein [Kofleriaceae bacterium]